MLRLIYSIILLSCLSFNAFAANQFANVNKGNINASGELSILRHVHPESNAFYLSPIIQYFIVDKFSFGGAVGLYESEANRTVSFGPAFTWHFWEYENLTAYVGERLIFNKTELKTTFGYTYEYWQSDTSIGLNYFIHPAVSFGPALLYHYNFRAPKDNNYFILGGAFGIYL